MSGVLIQSGFPFPAKASPGYGEGEAIGYSAEGRALGVRFCGNPAAGLRVFIMAGQHGDEPETCEAATEFAARFNRTASGATVHAAVLANVNPDGAIAGTRRNAQQIDLNRDHFLLSTPEIAAVHAFVNAWNPHMVIDVHTYRPWRRELSELDLAYAQDIMIDVTTNPAISTSPGPAAVQKAINFGRASPLSTFAATATPSFGPASCATATPILSMPEMPSRFVTIYRRF